MDKRPALNTGATRARLTAAMEQSPAYLQPIIKSVRDYGTAMLFVPQGKQSFRIPEYPKKPAIVILGDDFDAAVGPSGFHMPSVRRVIRACFAFAVVSSAPQPFVYEAVARMASLARRNVMLVETRLEEELPWLELIQKLAPRRFIWLATVEGGRA